MELRRATLADGDALAELHADAVTIGYTHIFPASSPAPRSDELKPGWIELLEDAAAQTYVAVANQLVVGSVVLAADAAVPSGQLVKRLHVSPRLWGQRLGSTSHDHIVEIARAEGARELNLWVLEGNRRARAMYERRDWHLCSPRRTLADKPPTILDVLYEKQLAPRWVDRSGP